MAQSIKTRNFQEQPSLGQPLSTMYNIISKF